MRLQAELIDADATTRQSIVIQRFAPLSNTITENVSAERINQNAFMLCSLLLKSLVLMSFTPANVPAKLQRGSKIVIADAKELLTLKVSLI